MLNQEEMLNLILSNHQFVVIDIETTGFTPQKGAEIIEIGAYKYDFQTNRKERFQSFIKPRKVKKLPAKIVQLTHISDADVQDAPYLEAVLTEFHQFIGNHVLAFHNAKFDWERFLLAGFEQIGIRPKNPVVCTLTLSKKLLPLVGYPQSRYNLKDICSYFGADIKNAHRAGADALYTTALLGKLRTIGADVWERATCSPLSLPQEDKPAIKIIPFEQIHIHRIQFWQKGKEERLYITTNAADIYYDYTRQFWSVQRLRTKDSLNMSFWEDYLMQQLNISDLSDWLETKKNDANPCA